MDSTICRYCNQQFYSSSNRRRHELYVHQKKGLVKMEDYDYQESNNSSQESNDTEKSVKDVLDEEGSDSESPENEEDYWATLIIKTCREMDIGKEIEKPKDILNDPILSEFLEELRENLDGRMKFAEYMQIHDKVYQEIQDTAEHYSRKDIEESEAFEKAWNKRKYLLKRLLRDNLDVIKEVMEEGNDSEEEQEEEDDNNNQTDGSEEPVD